MLLFLNIFFTDLWALPFGCLTIIMTSYIVQKMLGNHITWHINDKHIKPPECLSEFGGRIFQQTIGIPMGTNCAPLLADLFLYSYEAEFVQSLLQAGKKHLAQQFNFTYRYIDDVLSLKNAKFAT